MILVDSSVWITVFRRRRSLDLEAVVPLDEIVTCPPVIQEVLQGFQDERAYRIARNAMLAFPRVEDPMGLEVYLGAADLFRTALSRGYRVRSSIDCVIATCALRNDLEVLHHDRDYTHLARVSRLRERSP